MARGDRVIRVSNGAVEYVTGRVTERDGKDLSAAGFEVGLGGSDTPPVVWSEASAVSVDGATAHVSMLVGAGTALVDRAYLWVRVTDAPEVLPRRCEGGTVTVI